MLKSKRKSVMATKKKKKVASKKKSNKTYAKIVPKSRSRKLVMLAVVVLVAAVGVKLLLNSLAATPFVYTATHPQASQQSTSLGKTLLTLKAWNGKIYAGYGDYDANTGPISVTTFDPVTNTFAAAPGVTDQTEAIYIFRALGAKLYAPSADPRGGVSTDYAADALVGGTDSWQQVGPSNPPLTGIGFTHAFDLATLNGSDLWEVGSKAGNAAAFRSLDGGVTWQQMLSVPPRGPNAETRFYMAAVYNGKLYLEDQDFDYGAAANSNVFDGVSWSKGPQFPGGGRHSETFAGKLVYLTGFYGYPSAGAMYAFDGAKFQSVGPSSFWDYTVDGTTLYGLAYNSNIYKTTDLVNWTLVQAAPATARSIAVLNNIVYLGTTDSQIWSYNLANGIAGGTTTSTGGTTPGGGKQIKGTGGGKGHNKP
jgi:hypothetical protein